MEHRNILKDVTFKHSFMNNVDFAHAHTLTYTLTYTQAHTSAWQALWDSLLSLCLGISPPTNWL